MRQVLNGSLPSGWTIQRYDGKEPLAPEGAKQDSSRFAGDKLLDEVRAKTATLKKGASGIEVTKLQQALVDMQYELPKFGVDGKLGDETVAALQAFQTDHSLSVTGEFDAATMAEMERVFDTRQPYIKAATFDPAHPDVGARTLLPDDKAAALKAMVPPRGVAGASTTFQDVVGGKHYADEIRDGLTKTIDDLHKELYEDKKPLRADPANNFHDWSALESTALASKQVTDALYGALNTGPPMTHAAGNFVDQWEDEENRNKALSNADKKEKATGKVWYLIVSNLDDISRSHSAVPTDATEKGLLGPVVASFVDTDPKVQRLLELDIGWEGAQLEGTVYLQRYKKDTQEKNRQQLWDLFHTCIHEYIHSLADPKYQAYAKTFSNKGDTTRYNTLIEGFDDFFTETVRKTIVVTDQLRRKIEGPFFDATAAVPVVSPGIYPSIAQAEEVVSVVGIHNAELSYFKGRVDLIGG